MRGGAYIVEGWLAQNVRVLLSVARAQAEGRDERATQRAAGLALAHAATLATLALVQFDTDGKTTLGISSPFVRL